MPFSRYGLFYKKTLAWRLFKRHHTHFNQIYWSHKAAKTHVYACTRPLSRQDSTGDLIAFAKGNRRVPDTLGRWADSYSAFDQWTQMGSVIAIAGYLETFVAQIATSAIESCPSLLFGGGPKIDGVIYLKHNPSYDLYKHVEGLVRGDWQSRISAYRKLFSRCPFESHISQLEKLRKLRNDAGHSFGRDIESMKFAEFSLVRRLPKVSDTNIIEYLACIEAVADLVENQLSGLVGQYEIIKLYRRWLSTSGCANESRKEIASAFSVHVNELTGNPYGKSPGLKLIEYYDAI